MNERRSKLSILKDILRTIEKENDRAKPTHILYGANLSHDRLKKYLDTLVTEGFIEKKEEKGQFYYSTTLKGKEFFSGINKMKKFFEAFGVEI